MLVRSECNPHVSGSNLAEGKFLQDWLEKLSLEEYDLLHQTYYIKIYLLNLYPNLPVEQVD